MEHTVSAYEQDLRSIAADNDRLGAMALSQLRAALEIIGGRDGGGVTAQQVMAEDKRLNAEAQEIERKVVRLIALRQPMADDLRHAIAALKCALDLERCGDLAKNIAKRSLRIEGTAPAEILETLDRLGEAAVHALEQVLAAHRNGDVEAAREVWRGDDVVDERHEQLVRSLLAWMSREPSMTAAGAQLLFVAKNLERIGDHATNIAELVCYEATGSAFIPKAPPVVGADA